MRFIWIMVIDGNCSDLQAIEQPITIDMTGFDARLLPISLDVVEPVGVELAGNDGGVDVLRFFFLQKGTNLFGQLLVYLPQQLIYFGSVVADDLNAPVLVCSFWTSCSYKFECMAERSVTDIMQESGKKCDTFAVLVIVALLLGDDVGKTTRDVIDADAVGKAAVRCAGEYQLRESELANAS